MSISDQIHAEVVRAKSELYPDTDDLQDIDKLIVTISDIAATAAVNFIINRNSDVIPADDFDFPLVLAEWADQFTLKSHYDRVLAIMVFMRQYEDVRTVATADIIQKYEKSRWTKPKNMADIIAKGAERLYFAEAGTSEEGNKLWQMTRTGYDYLMSLKTEV